FVPSLALAPLFCLSPPACRVLVFFFSGPRPPRHLHSFPTRRSSDLVDQLQRVVDEVRRGLPPASSARGTALLAFRHGVPPVVTLDRKSTRLNSSHVSISYAVFCLKKKKHPPTPTARVGLPTAHAHTL